MAIAKRFAWKRAVIFSSLGAGVALYMSGRRAAGFALAGIGVGGLAYENREKISQIASDLPPFLEKTSKILETVIAVSQGLAEARRAAVAS